MKYKVVFLLVFISFYAFSQTHRFVYEMKYKSDSISDDYRTDNMILDITDDEVQFYEYWAIRTDSINSKGNGSKYYSFILPKLKRKVASSKNKNYYFLDEDYFYFETHDKLKWKIHSEVKTKENWTLQKATTDFGGRKWEAWFTQDLPFNEGPYKMNGLPSLIVELKDSKENYIFDLVSVENPQHANVNLVEQVFAKKPLKITLKKYKELLMNYYNDPYSYLKRLKPGSWVIEINGKEINSIEGLNGITKETQADIRRKNNPLELNHGVEYN